MSYSHHGYAPTPAALIGGGAAAMTPQGAHILHPTGIPASIMTAPTNVTEIVNVFVPNSMVGALIGTKVRVYYICAIIRCVYVGCTNSQHDANDRRTCSH
jgi:hypothetical protein